MDSSAASYRKSLQAFRGRIDEEERFCALLDDVKTELGLESAQDCVSIGIGSGTFDLAFIARCLPALKSVTTVDKDDSNIDGLRQNLANHLPSGVDVSIRREAVENWMGPDEGRRVDVVLALHVCAYLDVATRSSMFRRCFNDWLKPDGRVVVLVMNRDRDLVFRQVLRRMLATYEVPDADAVRDELTSAGYDVVGEYEYQFHQNYSDPDDHLLRFFNYVGRCSVELSTIRDLLLEIVPVGHCEAFAKLLVVKKKSPEV